MGHEAQPKGGARVRTQVQCGVPVSDTDLLLRAGGSQGSGRSPVREKDTGTQDREAPVLSPKLDQCRPLVAT